MSVGVPCILIGILTTSLPLCFCSFSPFRSSNRALPLIPLSNSPCDGVYPFFSSFFIPIVPPVYKMSTRVAESDVESEGAEGGSKVCARCHSVEEL